MTRHSTSDKLSEIFDLYKTGILNEEECYKNKSIIIAFTYNYIVTCFNIFEKNNEKFSQNENNFLKIFPFSKNSNFLNAYK
jgi:hypothetical protein